MDVCTKNPYLWTKSTDTPCLGLCVEREFCSPEGVGLGHRMLGAVEAVADKRPKERVTDLAVDGEVVLFGLVDEVHMITTLLAGDVDVLAQFDVAFGAEDDRAAVAPTPWLQMRLPPPARWERTMQVWLQFRALTIAWQQGYNPNLIKNHLCQKNMAAVCIM